MFGIFNNDLFKWKYLVMLFIIIGHIVCGNLGNQVLGILLLINRILHCSYFISFSMIGIVYGRIEQSCSFYHLRTDHSQDSPYKAMYEIYASPMILYNYKLPLASKWKVLKGTKNYGISFFLYDCLVVMVVNARWWGTNHHHCAAPITTTATAEPPSGLVLKSLLISMCLTW